ncbi:GntR family transcriptional regulator [Cochlodiniinecator piscidefendens]|uniref:GntR family transcriptional regulator n=1 Tax=Cochlodiniinecator piscidefendens TaxID=2715756 RepID=UPI001407D031|nr:GntR family transcriptional regulator [Cochlodiniinecator piscidefendens]
MDKAINPEKDGSENLSAQIYADLRLKLIVGELRPAESLSIRTLAEKYNVSAMPVREALRQLASENALIGVAKKAYRVPDLTSDEAANLFFLRAVLEGAAAEVAVANIKEADFTLLSRFVDDMEKTWAKRDCSAFLLSNFHFHRHVYSLTGNGALQDMIEALYVRTGPWLALGIVNLENPDHWMGEHPEIIAALRAGDAAEARRLTEEDARWGMQLYRELG